MGYIQIFLVNFKVYMDPERVTESEKICAPMLVTDTKLSLPVIEKFAKNAL